MLRRIVFAAALGSIALVSSTHADAAGGGAHVKVFSGSTGQTATVYRPSTGAAIGSAPRESQMVMPRAKIHARKAGRYDGPD